jgi:predicted solute-binding protein
MNSIHTYNCIAFRVLILKVVVIYFEALLIIVLKESNHVLCVCHTSLLTYDHHGLKYMNTSMNL